ncbi:MAG: hypothetical protein ChlgKO_01940 [Chlamydiales bacterium]
MSLSEDYKPHAIEFEKKTHYPYIDSTGNPTIGIGHKLGTFNIGSMTAAKEKVKNNLENLTNPQGRILDNNDYQYLLREKSVISVKNEMLRLTFYKVKGTATTPNRKGYFVVTIAENHYYEIPDNFNTAVVEESLKYLLEASIKFQVIKDKNSDYKGIYAENYFSSNQDPLPSISNPLATGPNNIAIKEKTVNELYEKDANEKINQLKIYFATEHYTETLPNIQIGGKKFSDWYEKKFNKKPQPETWTTFVDFPNNVQLALLDMSYNMGASGLIKKFPTFCQLVREKQWEKIIKDKEYSRLGVSSVRNNNVKNWFENPEHNV